MAALDIVDDAAPAEAVAEAPRLMAEIVDATGFARLGPAWEALVASAVVPNVSMHPAVAAAAAAGSGAEVRVALAWRRGAGAEAPRLMGAWVLSVGRLSRANRARALNSPADRNLILGGPVVDRDQAEDTVHALLRAIARDRSLPGLIQAREYPDQGVMHDALRGALARLGGSVTERRRLVRPRLLPAADAEAYFLEALSPKRRGGLRRCRRRLEESGVVTVTTHRSPPEVGEAFEAFLEMEASGWKGERGTALANRGTDFVRRMIGGLADHGRVTIWALRLDGRPVAMEVLLDCGGVVHTWKAAYDEEMRPLGPGFLLFEDVTRALLADPDLAFGDMSNNREFRDPHGVAAFWTGRHEVADLLIAVRPSAVAALRAVALVGRVRAACGALFRKPRTG